MRRSAGAFLERLRDPNGFLGPVAKLAGGTLIGHGITGAALLVLARLYTPSEFGVFAMYSAVIYVLAVAVCLRLDVAIALPEQDERAFEVFSLAILATLAIAALTAAILAAIPAALLGGENLHGIAPYLWLIPVNLLALGVFSAMQNWFIRRKGYNLLAASRVSQSGAAAAAQVILGALGSGVIGLIVGLILTSAAGAAFMAKSMLADVRGLAPGFRWTALRSTLSRYRAFPQFSVWEALANSAAIQLPIFLIGLVAGTAELGQVTLAMMVVQAPMALFGTSAAQVFLSQAPERARNGQLHAFTVQTMRSLAIAGFPLLIALGLAAPFLFPLLFGPEWSRAGLLVSWMTPWLLLQFVSSPVSSVLSITGHLGIGMVLQVGGLLFRTGAIVAAAYFDSRFVSEAFAVSGAIFYLIYSVVILRLAFRSRGAIPAKANT